MLPLPAVPQVCHQLAVILQAALSDQLLTMDTMTDVSDPRVAVGTAQHHLDQAHDDALELYKSLDGAYQLTAHLVSHSTST